MKLSPKQKQVFDIVSKHDTGISLKEIAINMNAKPHQISGRITELKSIGLITKINKKWFIQKSFETRYLLTSQKQIESDKKIQLMDEALNVCHQHIKEQYSELKTIV